MAQLADRVAGVGIPGWFLLLLSVFIGSFLGTVIRRLPEGRPIMMSARSACEACGARLAPRDLVPLVSWLAARGRCRYCGVALGWFYPGVELGALAVATIAITIDGPEQAWLDCLLGWWLLALGWIDLRVWLLPDALTLPLLVLGLLVTLAFDPEDLADRAAAAAIGYLALRAIGWIYERLRGREGLGQGDAKLFAAAGAWLGTAALSQVVLLAAAAALLAAAAVGLSGTRIRAHTALPFGPFLALAIWPLWLFGPIHL
ncbi:MAG: prepilin peptidase [Alphaproteobacteria bacterium]|nr:MAG: prepilin peptidase [Alphaproteobacteria bacterium]